MSRPEEQASAATAHAEIKFKERFRLLSFDEIKHSTGAAALISGVLPIEGLILVYGPPKCGKSFLILDMSLHIALERQYRGRRTKQGGVVYVACEGERGLAARIEAFRQKKMAGEKEKPPVPFFLLPTRLDLIAEHEALIKAIEDQTGAQKISVIAIDTLNRSLFGSENSDQDMGAYIKAADAIREYFKCAVILIHHSGLAVGRPRGHTSLPGAVDAQIAVKKTHETVIAEVELMKDGEAGAVIYSELEQVIIGVDEDGENITSCVIKPVNEPLIGPGKRLTGQSKIAFDQLILALSQTGKIPSPDKNIPPDMPCVQEEVWREYCIKGSISDSDQPDSKRKAFKRAFTYLQQSGKIKVWDGWVWDPDYMLLDNRTGQDNAQTCL